jgi:hypothetical protein
MRTRRGSLKIKAFPVGGLFLLSTDGCKPFFMRRHFKGIRGASLIPI